MQQTKVKIKDGDISLFGDNESSNSEDHLSRVSESKIVFG